MLFVLIVKMLLSCGYCSYYPNLWCACILGAPVSVVYMLTNWAIILVLWMLHECFVVYLKLGYLTRIVIVWLSLFEKSSSVEEWILGFFFHCWLKSKFCFLFILLFYVSVWTLLQTSLHFFYCNFFLFLERCIIKYKEMFRIS